MKTPTKTPSRAPMKTPTKTPHGIDEDGGASLLGTVFPSPRYSVHTHTGAVRCCACSEEYDLVVSGGEDGVTTVHSMRTAEYIRSITPREVHSRRRSGKRAKGGLNGGVKGGVKGGVNGCTKHAGFGGSSSRSRSSNSGSIAQTTKEKAKTTSTSVTTTNTASASGGSSGSGGGGSASASGGSSIKSAKGVAKASTRACMSWVGVSRHGVIVTYASDKHLTVYSINGRQIARRNVGERLFALTFSEDGQYIIGGGESRTVTVRALAGLDTVRCIDGSCRAYKVRGHV
jgi:WD40 repeat protein